MEGGGRGLGYPSPDMRICLKAMYVIRVGVLYFMWKVSAEFERMCAV